MGWDSCPQKGTHSCSSNPWGNVRCFPLPLGKSRSVATLPHCRPYSSSPKCHFTVPRCLVPWCNIGRWSFRELLNSTNGKYRWQAAINSFLWPITLPIMEINWRLAPVLGHLLILPPADSVVMDLGLSCTFMCMSTLFEMKFIELFVYVYWVTIFIQRHFRQEQLT